MKNRLAYLLFALMLFLSGTTCSAADFKILWEEPQRITKGGYARVHRLNDGRLMMSYAKSFSNYFRFSDDNGLTWSEEENKVMSPFVVENDRGKARLDASNPEFAQLSAENPFHPGRIIFACNYRPKWLKPGVGDENMSSVHPYTISIKTSDDGGETWSGVRHVYRSELWYENVLRGCWEPFVLELPNGIVQIYFADETPYWKKGSKWQNISVIESADGGDTWSPPRVVSQNGGFRDGMPVVAIHDGMLLMAIETAEHGTRLFPAVVCNSIDNNWKEPVGKDSDLRFHPFRRSLKSDLTYSGAPYIITTDDYIVYSYQISDESESAQENNARHATMEVQICPKKEVKDGFFYSMRASSRPIDVDQSVQTAVWNSLCHLGGDEILAVSQFNGHVYLVRGKIISK
jgi:hypothetical protein